MKGFAAIGFWAVGLLMVVDLQAGPTNDSFANSARFEGTNVFYVGNLSGATREPGEPDSDYSNTIWVSWAVPHNGRARAVATEGNRCLPLGIYKGTAVDVLAPVRWTSWGNCLRDFLASEGEIYHFQLSGGSTCQFTVELLPYGPTTNDFFANGRRIAGALNPGYAISNLVYYEWFPIEQATTEFGEPAHLNGLPCKSLWWRWTPANHGAVRFWPDLSLATNITYCVYQGQSIESLVQLAKITNSAQQVGVYGGEVYHIAAVVPTDAAGDVLIRTSGSLSTAVRIIPGNLLQEPSWEGTSIFNAQYWKVSGSIGGGVNEPGGADGTTWIGLARGAKVWQDIETVPGRLHAIRFALRGASMSSDTSEGRVRVLWDGQEIGVAVLPAGETSFWHWPEMTAVANNSTSTVTFVSLNRTVEMDAFSVVSMAEPPQIVNQPTSASVVNGGAVSFTVGATGTTPLTYAWHFNGAPIQVSVNPVLALNSVTTNQAGNYWVVVTNAFGSVTSAPVALAVENPTAPVILWQPFGDTVGVGGYFSLSVVAAGASPLMYQWYKDSVAVAGETNRLFVFPAVDFANSGTYAVKVQNSAGAVWSLGARLMITNAAIGGGGAVVFANHVGSFVDAPVYDVDGISTLGGSNYLAQLYGGPSLAMLRPVGQPSAFRSGFNAGYFYSQTLTLPTVPEGSNAVLQVRVWDSSKGISYEEARALGGRFGKSELLHVSLGGMLMPPPYMEGLQRFNLNAGRPQFATGKITFEGRVPRGVTVWSHYGEPGFRYLIEKSLHGFEWQPFIVVTNIQDTVTFTDSANAASSVVFFRSRILD